MLLALVVFKLSLQCKKLPISGLKMVSFFKVSGWMVGVGRWEASLQVAQLYSRHTCKNIAYLGIVLKVTMVKRECL